MNLKVYQQLTGSMRPPLLRASGGTMGVNGIKTETYEETIIYYINAHLHAGRRCAAAIQCGV